MHRALVFAAVGFVGLGACGGIVETVETRAPPVALATRAAVVRAPTVTVPLLVEPLDDMGLFRDERDLAELGLFAWGQAQRFSLVPIERTRAILDRAAAGQRVETGEACGAPLPLWRAKARYAKELGAAGSLRAIVLCDAKAHGCHLDVDVLDTLEFGADYLASYRAPYDSKRPWAEAYALAIVGLAPAKDGDDSGGLLIGDLRAGLAGDARAVEPESLVVEARHAEANAPSDAAPSSIVFKGGISALRACFGADDDSVDPLVAVGGDGAITRCEPEDGGGASSVCACKVLMSRGEVAPALRGARAWVSIRFRAGDTTTRSGRVVGSSVDEHIERGVDHRGTSVFKTRVSDPSIADWHAPASSAIDRCFVDLDGTREVHATLTVHFDAVGKANAVDVEPRKSGAPTADETACVQKAMLASQVPCPAAPTSWAKAHLVVRTYPARHAP
jgi:hypothetical protein